jgi:hypothetical protein
MCITLQWQGSKLRWWFRAGHSTWQGTEVPFSTEINRFFIWSSSLLPWRYISLELLDTISAKGKISSYKVTGTRCVWSLGGAIRAAKKGAERSMFQPLPPFSLVSNASTTEAHRVLPLYLTQALSPHQTRRVGGINHCSGTATPQSLTSQLSWFVVQSNLSIRICFDNDLISITEAFSRVELLIVGKEQTLEVGYPDIQLSFECPSHTD